MLLIWVGVLEAHKCLRHRCSCCSSSRVVPCCRQWQGLPSSVPARKGRACAGHPDYQTRSASRPTVAAAMPSVTAPAALLSLSLTFASSARHQRAGNLFLAQPWSVRLRGATPLFGFTRHGMDHDVLQIVVNMKHCISEYCLSFAARFFKSAAA
jgi:hypothetical protein